MRPSPWFGSALICVCLGLAWQVLTVHYIYGGNWSGLFITGSKFPYPQALDSENLYVLPDSTGYDGQMYHYIAHDPLIRHGFLNSIDIPRLRYRRILLPALAFILAGGQQSFIGAAYIASTLLFVFLGAWWLARYLALCKRNPAWSILFLLLPAVVTALQRLTIDVSLAALCAGFIYYTRIGSRRRLYLLLALAGLSRETGLVLTFAFWMSQILERRYARSALFSTAALPTGLWYLFVNSRTAPIGGPPSLSLPFAGLGSAMLHPVVYPFSPAVNGVLTTLDYLAMIGILMAGVMAWHSLYQNPSGQFEIAASLWAAGVLFLPQAFWQDCCSSGRVFTPLLLFLFLRGSFPVAIAWSMPLILVSLRTWVQLVSPCVQIVKGLLRHG